jgi:hypothetical protein
MMQMNAFHKMPKWLNHATCKAIFGLMLFVHAASAFAALTFSANDDYQITQSVPSGTRSVLDNDQVNGVAASGYLSQIQVSIVGSYGFDGATIGVNSNQELTYANAVAFTGAWIQYQICERALPTNCSSVATASVNLTGSFTRKAPSAPGALSSSSNVITAGQSPISFGTGGPAQAGSINDGIVLSGVRVSFGDNIGGLNFLTLNSSQNIPNFVALLMYSGAGQLKARWEVIQPSDPDPSDVDIVPEDGLTAGQLIQRHSYTLIDRPFGYLAPTGSYLLRGPDASRLPRSRLGTYRILLRLEAMGSGRTGNFYIPFLTYRIQSDPSGGFGSSSSGIGSTADGTVTGASGSTGGSAGDGTVAGSSGNVKSKFTGNTGVADFSKIGELDVGGVFNEGGGLKIANFEKKPPRTGFESINTTLPKAGQQVNQKEAFKLTWDEAKQATVEIWHLEIRTESGQLLSVSRIPKKNEYTMPRTLSDSLPLQTTLRWRVQGLDKEGQVTATSAWLFFMMSN